MMSAVNQKQRMILQKVCELHKAETLVPELLNRPGAVLRPA